MLAAVFSITGCKTKKSSDIAVSYKGHLITSNGEINVTIDFTGEETAENGDKVLKAVKLMVRGESMEKNIEFKSPYGKKSSGCWVFTTSGTGPMYPYGIVTISYNYQSIVGQVPDEKSMMTFYSEDIQANNTM